MAIPDKPLELSIDADNITVGELELFEGENFKVSGLRAFLVNHSNWTDGDIKGLSLKELRQVVEQVGEAMKTAAVPLGS